MRECEVFEESNLSDIVAGQQAANYASEPAKFGAKFNAQVFGEPRRPHRTGDPYREDSHAS